MSSLVLVSSLGRRSALPVTDDQVHLSHPRWVGNVAHGRRNLKVDAERERTQKWALREYICLNCDRNAPTCTHKNTGVWGIFSLSQIDAHARLCHCQPSLSQQHSLFTLQQDSGTVSNTPPPPPHSLTDHGDKNSVCVIEICLLASQAQSLHVQLKVASLSLSVSLSCSRAFVPSPLADNVTRWTLFTAED